jgi:hypothetical protein
MYSVQDLPKGGVAPFGHPRINDRSHLPAAFRSVPRPSSPLGAKASTERPSHTQLSTARTQDPSAPLSRRSEHHMSNRTAATPRTLTSYGLSAVRAYTRYHQIFFTMRNNNGTPASQNLRSSDKVVFRKLRHQAIARPRIHNLHLEAIGFEPMTPCLQSRCSTN